jgi:hypothetical protein
MTYKLLQTSKKLTFAVLVELLMLILLINVRHLGIAEHQAKALTTSSPVEIVQLVIHHAFSHFIRPNGIAG